MNQDKIRLALFVTGVTAALGSLAACVVQPPIVRYPRLRWSSDDAPASTVQPRTNVSSASEPEPRSEVSTTGSRPEREVPPAEPRVAVQEEPPPPEPEPAPRAQAQAKTKAKPRPKASANPYPEYGKRVGWHYGDKIPRYEFNKEYTFGNMVQEGHSSSPNYIYWRCIEKVCNGAPRLPNEPGRSGSRSDWEAVAWFQGDEDSPE